MSSLSFVALSMQTTHLDPATVSQAAYLKMVDGQVTRLDNIFIIPPTVEAGVQSPPHTVTWSEALSQLGMVIGKLPIVSYYRDADKEIFQAASRRSGTELPHFQWLDCRALTRELLPDLPDHQPSTVLKALGLYEEHADGGTVEQTAQIVLKLAEDHAASTVKELWEDLYDQPDDLLDLEATLTGLSAPETVPPAEDVDGGHESVEMSVLPTADMESEPLPLQSQSPADTGGQAPDELTAETDIAAESTTGTESTNADKAASSETPEEESYESKESRQHSDSALASDADAGAEDLGDSTAQSVIASENLEQPEFLKVPDMVEPHQDELSNLQVETTVSETVVETSETVESVPEAEPVEVEVGEEQDEISPPDAPEPQTVDPQADQLPPAVHDESAPHDEAVSSSGEMASQSHTRDDEPAESNRLALTETAPPQPSATTKPFDPVYQVITPAAVPRSGKEGPATSATTVVVEADSRPSAAHGSRKAGTGRLWGILGMVVFGLLTLVGAILTVMATMLFFTANNLLMETKIAGVVLTSAITLLSVLMATLSYRLYRRK